MNCVRYAGFPHYITETVTFYRFSSRQVHETQINLFLFIWILATSLTLEGYQRKITAAMGLVSGLFAFNLPSSLRVTMAIYLGQSAILLEQPLVKSVRNDLILRNVRASMQQNEFVDRGVKRELQQRVIINLIFVTHNLSTSLQSVIYTSK